MTLRRKLPLLLFIFSLIAPHTLVQAQEPARQQPATGDVEALRKRLEEQAAQLEQLQKAVGDQLELIRRQESQITDLQRAAASAKPAPAKDVAQNLTASAAPAPVAAPAKPAPPAGVEPGYGKIKFSGLLQGWYTSGNGGVKDSFRIRRAELKFTGDITSQIKWTVMIDPAKSLALNNTYTTVAGTKVLADTSVNQAGRMLQEAFISYELKPNMRLWVGQFKLPLSMEGLQSSGALDTIERAMFASDRGRGGSYGDIRDLGAMLSGTLHKQIDYQIGMFNGSGESQNDVDKGDQKAVIGRLVFRPAAVRGLQFGGSGAWGRGVRAENPRHDRLGAEVRYSRDKFTFKSEVMRGADADLKRIGYYAHVGYRATGRLEPVLRVDFWDPDRRRETNASNVSERDFVTGFNYLLAENHAKLQLNYVRKTFANGIVPSRNLITLGLQTSW